MTSGSGVLGRGTHGAEALARIRDAQRAPAVAAQVFVARAPMATPTAVPGRGGTSIVCSANRRRTCSRRGRQLHRPRSTRPPPLAEITRRWPNLQPGRVSPLSTRRPCWSGGHRFDVLDHPLPRDCSDRYASQSVPPVISGSAVTAPPVQPGRPPRTLSPVPGHGGGPDVCPAPGTAGSTSRASDAC